VAKAGLKLNDISAIAVDNVMVWPCRLQEISIGFIHC